MKKFFYIITVVAAMGFTACTGGSNQNGTNDQVQQNEGQSKTLVAYFSASGVTEGVAKDLAAVTGGTLYKIDPEQPYTDKDLDWRDSTSRSSVEMKDLSSRPAIKGKVESIEQYDTVFVGFPVWWYTAPTIINTFIEANDFKGKVMIPFATSGGSTIDKSAADLAKTYPDLNWQPGRLLNGANQDTIRAWLGK